MESMSESDEPVSQDQSSKYWKYRNELIALEQKSQAEYDRLVASLSGGALGVSFAFVERFVGDDPARVLWALRGAWFAWVFSLACVLLSHYVSTLALRKTMEQIDKGRLYTERVGGFSDRVLVCLNPLGAATFILGAIFAGVFVWYNLE